jgi:prophage antirepressor-like protein
MKNLIQKFHSKEFGSIDILLDGEKLYFPAAECARILGYSNPHKAVRDHCSEDGRTNRSVIDRLGRTQTMQYINEGNLYRLIVRSKLPAAMRFEKWIFDEVLPCIRKHGAYIIEELLEAAEKSQDFALELIGKLTFERKKTAALEDINGRLAPKARYCDQVLQCRNVVPVSLIAKDYGMAAAAFNTLLHNLGIQYKTGGAWLLYQAHAGKGYTKSRTYTVSETTSVTHTYWTQKGRLFLYEKLKSCGIVPLLEACRMTA